MKTLLIDEQFAQEILDYLQRRPYVEVYQLIAKMAQLKLSPFQLGEDEKTPENKEDKQPRPNEKPE